MLQNVELEKKFKKHNNEALRETNESEIEHKIKEKRTPLILSSLNRQLLKVPMTKILLENKEL